jgi:hypothetical protein
MPARVSYVSYRVLRQGRMCGVSLTPWGGTALWVSSREIGNICESLWVVLIPSSAAPGCLMPC